MGSLNSAFYILIYEIYGVCFEINVFVETNFNFSQILIISF